MNRRDILACLAATGVGLDAQLDGEQPTSESLYIPKPHLVEDRKLLFSFMEEFPFVDLVTASPNIRVTHIPALVDRSAGPYGTIRGHIARHNPQSATFDGKQAAVIVFRGPHRYISPAWYGKTDVVPTWNFAVVHASGKLKPIADKKQLHDLLATLIDKFEYDKSVYDFAKLPMTYKYGMIEGIIGFEMEIELLEGKFKLGQERSEADKTGVLKNLPLTKPPRSIAEFTAEFYKWKATHDSTHA